MYKVNEGCLSYTLYLNEEFDIYYSWWVCIKVKSISSNSITQMGCMIFEFSLLQQKVFINIQSSL